MGFFLKKFVSFFLEPLGLVVMIFAFGLVSLFLKRYKGAKIAVAFGVLSLLLFAYPPFASWLITPLEQRYTKLTPEALHSSIRYIHVLGNGHTTDSDQSISSQLSPAGVKRVLEGVLLHKQLPNTKLIFTGYEGDTSTSNAKMNATLALALGVKKENIIIGESPKDTRQEAAFSSSVLHEEPFILVTSASHMPRSIALFEKEGLHPIPAPTDFHKEEFTTLLRAPRAYYFHLSSVAIHEYLGMVWDFVRG